MKALGTVVKELLLRVKSARLLAKESSPSSGMLEMEELTIVSSVI
jgi:hypothetical protein